MNSLRSTGRFSIKTLLMRQNEFARPVACQHFTRVSQLIKDRTGSGESYTDTYIFCLSMKKRITKKSCKNCNLYYPIKK